MRDQMGERLEALRSEYAAGQNMLTELVNRQAELQQTLLRISGAIQVLEELLGEESEAADPPAPATLAGNGAGTLAPAAP